MIEPLFCPACGRETTYRANPEWLLGHWKGQYVNMLAVLCEGRRVRRGVSMQELMDAAYIDRPDPTKRPMNADHSIRAILATNADKLKKLGWQILGPRTTGNGFWLVPLEMD